MALREVKLGLVGTGTGIVGQVSSALIRQGKLLLTEVFDPCLVSAKIDADEVAAKSSPSLDGMLRRTSGIIVADVKWMGVEPMVRAAGLQRPALLLLAAVATLKPKELARLRHLADLASTLVMPELPLRWGRSTLRLRELNATKLRGIEEMHLTCRCRSGSVQELLVFDWCINVVQSECLFVLTDANTGSVRLQFLRKQQDGSPVTVHIHFQPAENDDSSSSFPIVESRVRCVRGSVHITSEFHLEWNQSGEASQAESLQTDRSSGELMYDLFGRRLVGGLVPVPDVSDLLRAHALRAAWIQSGVEKEEVVPNLAFN